MRLSRNKDENNACGRLVGQAGAWACVFFSVKGPLWPALPAAVAAGILGGKS